MDWQTLPFPELLNELPKGLATIIALLLIFLGYRKGTTETQTPKKEVEIAGALVDNSAIFKLASAIEAQNAVLIKGQEQTRQVVESFNRFAEELHELTKEIRDSVTSILRSRR